MKSEQIKEITERAAKQLALPHGRQATVGR
jgi:hypothetical protein